MLTELKSIPDIWKRMPSEMHARRFLENIIWCNWQALSALRVGGLVAATRQDMPPWALPVS
jgi:hypothetical protein